MSHVVVCLLFSLSICRRSALGTHSVEFSLEQGFRPTTAPVLGRGPRPLSRPFYCLITPALECCGWSVVPVVCRPGTSPQFKAPSRSSLCIQGFNRNILGRHWIRPDNRCLAVSSLAHVRPFWRTTCPALGLVVFGALVRGQCGVRTPIRSLHQRSYLV